MNFTRFYWLVLVCLIVGCEPEKPTTEHMAGKTMGTTYSLKLPLGLVEKAAVDSILNEINQAVSTYEEQSLISRFNRDSFGIKMKKEDPRTNHFIQNIVISEQVYQLSGGAFDPSVMPLVNLWGFGYEKRSTADYPDSNKVDSVLTLIGFDNFNMEESDTSVVLSKEISELELDFSAVAKGYAVDRIADYIAQAGADHFMVEIGGEVFCKGKRDEDRNWVIGINKPVEGTGSNEISAKVELADRAMATSGNYRNFYEVDGRKVSHSINPNTGYPERSTLLSATVVHRSCAHADAMATACMILGLEKAKDLINKAEGFEAFFISGGEKGDFVEWQSSGFPNIQIIE